MGSRLPRRVDHLLASLEEIDRMLG